MQIAQTVQQLREEQGFSQARLADRAHVTLRALRNVECAKTARPRTIERIARALGLTPRELYERAARAIPLPGMRSKRQRVAVDQVG